MLFLIVSAIGVQAQKDSLILMDNFTTTGKFTDLTKKLIWSDSGDTTSGFILKQTEDSQGMVQNCLSLTEEAIEKTGYNHGTIKASQAIDYVIPEKLDRLNSTYKIEFDALWEELNNNGWGESGRIVVTLLHDYPDEIPFDAIYNLEEEAPFGRPAYNLRIRNHNKTGDYYSGAFMLYGGGHDINGEVEIYNNEYWLPGFSSEAGGTTPGLSEPYPLSPTMKNENFVTVGYPNWKHYTWLIKPERLEFYVRESYQDESENELVFLMQIPKSTKSENKIIEEINAAHQSTINDLPVLYNWFRWIEAIRIYFRGAEQAHLANFKLSKVLDTPLAFNKKEHQSAQPLVYPNPCVSSFIIENKSARKMSFALYNSNGTMMKNGIISDGLTIRNVNVESLSEGLYILKTSNHKQTNIQKIIINK
ncbi:MAG TPA: T9SS type A sorting domain-containing protein [Tangfeifania sp.]|nr:T9SS type A sorting domain-containing protein [Tangfeifania sp.]